VAMCFKCFRV